MLYIKKQAQKTLTYLIFPFGNFIAKGTLTLAVNGKFNQHNKSDTLFISNLLNSAFGKEVMKEKLLKVVLHRVRAVAQK